MIIAFKILEFFVNEKNQIGLKKFGSYNFEDVAPFVEVQIAGENKLSNTGAKMIGSSEGGRLKYVSHDISENRIEIVQRSECVLVRTVFNTYESTNAVRVFSQIQNISGKSITLESASSLSVYGLGKTKDADKIFITEFHQSHHCECQPRRFSFDDKGLDQSCRFSRISYSNIGSWSTKERLPQCIIENTTDGSFSMFQIESSTSWYYEISAFKDKDYYLYLGGASGGWSFFGKTLAPMESYTTAAAAVCFGNDLNSVVGEMTKYRREISGLCLADSNLAAVFNEYMHLCWDSPSQKTTAIYAPVVSKTGVEYYVIDCGWHDEVPGEIIYPYVGRWKESKTRFENSLKATTDFIRSLNMKPGLWIEPEVVGVKCEEMLSYYDDDCFLKRGGEKILVGNRYFLDYRNKKVVEYMSETIRRMVEDYGAEYIKFDYNREMGMGADGKSCTGSAAIEEAAEAFFNWVAAMKKRFPAVVFEGCASGGMRMDYNSLSVFSVVSTSDQTNFLKYPAIAANILTAVIPEQAAVWSYPVRKIAIPEIDQNSQIKIEDRDVVINMVNAMLGRIHLASDLSKLTEGQLKLVCEGVEVYKSLTEFKKTALPYFPMGLTRFSKEKIAAGLKGEGKIYLAVYALGEDREIEIDIAEEIKGVKMLYPRTANAEFEKNSKGLKVFFEQNRSAAFFELDCI